MPFSPEFKRRLKRHGVFVTLNKLRRKAHRAVCDIAAKLPISSRWFGPPKGCHISTRKFFEGFKSDPANPAIFRPLIESEKITIPAAKAVFGTEKEFFHTSHTYHTAEAFLATLPWGRFHRYPFAIIAPDDRMLADISVGWGDDPKDHWIFDQLWLGKPHTLHGKTFHLGSGLNCSNLFHLTYDYLPSLDLLERAGMRLAEFDHIILEVYGSPFANAILDHLGIPREKIVDPREHPHLLCDCLLYTSPSPRD